MDIYGMENWLFYLKKIGYIKLIGYIIILTIRV